MTIKIEETDSEYLLFIPAQQKERAKTIDGRRWDPERKCWVYPRTVRVFDALLAEFGDEVSKFPSPRPESVQEANKSDELNHAEDERLHEDLRALKATVESLIGAASKNEEVFALKQTVANLEKTLEATRTHLEDAKRELVQTQGLAETQERALDESKRSFELMQEKSDFLQVAKQMAKQSTGNDATYSVVVDPLPLDRSFPIEMSKALEKYLRYILGTNDKTVKLAELLSQARDSEKVSEEAFHLGHIIRRQRNILAHESVDQRTHRGRILLVLYASAVLWPELHEG